jgi:beta-keto acid cleavage enzyme
MEASVPEQSAPPPQAGPQGPAAILTIAPTGPVATTAQNPALPVTPEQIAACATRAYHAGAAVIHVHLRDEQQRPTADLDIARRTLDLIRDGSPIHIQLSTGVGFGVPFTDRARLAELQPTMATLNPCSMSFGNGEFSNPPELVRRLAARMRELGVRPELEIYDTGHLDVCLQLHDEGILEPPLQFSMVMGVRGGMAATARNLVHMVTGCRLAVSGRSSPSARRTSNSRRWDWPWAATPAPAWRTRSGCAAGSRPRTTPSSNGWPWWRQHWTARPPQGRTPPGCSGCARNQWARRVGPGHDPAAG